ncbi:hypothetical protein C5B42_04270 [Candidatus Cerribacteria bacterium 'Amazon FNV 2010 28 9']|uniref:Glycosyltransferase family 4 protein n=1 Tax=Candidatus Cerribacteria bacterium 'Amazon FNV 2010 28 9' TaxID=2081795 RepID=A0A317JT59_9BACT|nr:MAG: hypothetical protein C5B42_04270 [Candidatus Cerribacteria bacterium 'Amazon FNV 2010 28 9']
MRIVFFTETFAPAVNGVVTTLILYANELVARGHHVLIIAPDHGDFSKNAWGIDSRVQLFLIPSFDGKVYPNFRIGIPTLKLHRIVKQFHPDIVHSLSPLVLGLQAIIIAKRSHIPIVTSYLTNYTDEESLKALKQFPRTLLKQAQKNVGSVLKWYLNMHDAIHVPSLDTQHDIEKWGLFHPIHIIHSPILCDELAKGKKSGEKLRKELGIEHAVLFAGRLSGEKNIELALRAFAVAHEKIPTLKCVLIGNGPEREKLWKLAGGLGISPWIVWVGEVAHKELMQRGYYYLGDVFLTLSEFETQGMSTVEAMACGLDVVGANARGTKEILDGVGGGVDPYKTQVVAQCIVEKIRQKHASKELVHRAQEYDVLRCVDLLEEMYSSLLSSKVI